MQIFHLCMGKAVTCSHKERVNKLRHAVFSHVLVKAIA